LDLWPNAEVYFHGGVSFEPYRDQYRKLLPSDTFRYYETYNASEGFFAIQDQNDCSEMLLMLDYGIFYEFIPMETFGKADQKIIPLAQVELGKKLCYGNYYECGIGSLFDWGYGPLYLIATLSN
jgi:hypothetical protein